jgi:NodT family efflux transporter outer membrane factor (OMF) lipoprotein
MRPLLLAALLLCGCVGPNFKRPEPPAVERFTAENLPAATSAAESGQGAAQRFLNDAPERQWWKTFGSKDIDELVDVALKANPQVRSAQASLRQALENAAAQRGSYFPFVQAGFDASRNRDATGVLQPTLQSGQALYNLFTPQVSVSFVPDLFGGNRRQVEALVAQAEASRDQLDATYLSLCANVVNTAITKAGLIEQIKATRHVIDLSNEALSISRHELELGAIADSDVYAQETVLAQLEASLPPLEKQLKATDTQLAALIGVLPANYSAREFSLDALTLPEALPLGVPSDLVNRRPDVRAAEAQLHAATAQVGIAIANLLPQFTLSGDIGSSATTMSTLFKSGTGFWSLGASASQTLFAGGALWHKKKAADAALDQAGEDYKLAVLTAFQNVADALHALNADADALRLADKAQRAAEKSLAVARHQLDLGSVSYVALLNAETSYQQTLIQTVQARTSRLQDTVALYQALGGGFGS